MLAFLLWAGMFIAALLYVHRYGSPIPWGDDWANVPYVIGKRPITIKWLWSLHNEHRVPLPRLVYVAAMRAGGNDFRAGMYVNVFLLATIALLFLILMRRMRGRIGPGDLFFPLCLLSLAQFENLLWSFQLAFVISTFLFCFVLFQIAQLTEKDLCRRLLSIAAIAPL
ncbi:MAG TPA: hypothetical protein VI958_07015, partial [Acidobacteriota bacterium]